MVNRSWQIKLIVIVLCMVVQTAWAAPKLIVPQGIQTLNTQSVVQNIRYSKGVEKVRVVIDVTTLPEVTTTLTQSPDQLVIDFVGGVNPSTNRQVFLNDSFVSGVQLSEVEAGKQHLVIDLQSQVTYKVFTLKNPNRIVVDVFKDSNQKSEEQVAPGVKHISLLRSTPAGMMSIHLIDMAPGANYIVKPVLSNNAITGLEKLQSMAERNKVIAAVNGSYFALNGEVLGLLKMNGEIVSTSAVKRTVVGILPDGKVIMDQVDYKGSITLPDGKVVGLTGVNHERGTDNLVLYNSYYDNMTGTNTYGSDYSIKDGKIIGIGHGSVAIPVDGFVLSAHGTMDKALAGLKIGDTIQVTQTLGEVWDKTIYAIGAGPRLVKNGSVFLTTSAEQFPDDIASGRAPRTAVGVTKDGHVIFLVVDGRRSSSIGMTLEELAAFMQEFGVVDGMNLDGGGSSEMVVNGQAVNKPSDGHERSVGDALVITAKN